MAWLNLSTKACYLTDGILTYKFLVLKRVTRVAEN